MARTNPLQFIQQVRSEVSKVTWPARREVFLTTVMVFIMATLTAIFFALVDLAIRSGLTGILGLLAEGCPGPLEIGHVRGYPRIIP